jgi:hypothetical protein
MPPQNPVTTWATHDFEKNPYNFTMASADSFYTKGIAEHPDPDIPTVPIWDPANTVNAPNSIYDGTTDFATATLKDIALPKLPPTYEIQESCWERCKAMEKVREKNCKDLRERVSLYMKVKGCPVTINPLPVKGCGGR